jgi:hypothetical protein
MAIVAAIDPTEGRRKLADPVLPKAPPATNPSPMAAGLVAGGATVPGQRLANPAATAAMTRTKLLAAGMPDLMQQRERNALRGFGTALARPL